MNTLTAFGLALDTGEFIPAEQLNQTRNKPMTTKSPSALRREYRPTMPEGVLHMWAMDALACITELEDACRVNLENYQFQQSKADRATATVYQFHYAMKDAGWHPGRTDDDLTQIIRAKGRELAELIAGAARWVNVDERLPEPQKPVLLDIGKKYPIRAQMVPQYALTVGTDDADDFGEYDEETDEWYCPAGWYEWNQHEEIHWAVNEKPIAWSELPAAPSIAGAGNG